MPERGDRGAFGWPGIDPRWEHGDKAGVGTAYSGDSKLWFTLWRGIVTELYYPIVDHPQLRDLELLFSDGRSFFHEERRHLTPRYELLDPIAPGYRVTSTAPDASYTLEKEIITDPHQPVLLERIRLTRRSTAEPLDAYVLAAPHLDGGGQHNNGYVVEQAGRELLLAERNGIWLALGASVPFRRLSVGFVGASDGWTDLATHRRMEWEFDRAADGNIALTAALPPLSGPITLALAFGRSRSGAVTALLQSLATPYAAHRARFLEQWQRSAAHLPPFLEGAPDGGRLARIGHTTILAHEDKTYPGAFPASLSIPWGFACNDAARGGYHLVWTRDLCQAATGLLATGNLETPLRTLVYLAASQSEDGGFPQNFWLSGEPFWSGLQLDEVSFPILLAGRLGGLRALAEFDPSPMVMRAARFLVDRGPATAQERWEEAAGFSPSTLAAHISSLVVAGGVARARGAPEAAKYLEEYADFLEEHLEAWTVTRSGTLVPGLPRHYVRILPSDPGDPTASEELDRAVLPLANQAPATDPGFPAREIVDTGFLELVRYGVRRADDPTIQDSVRVIDAVLKVETPLGPSWHRYNHDGYGERDDGSPFVGWGRGRAWPLLTGERGHFELARGGDPTPYLAAMERFASETGLLPEQVWDGPDLAARHLDFGRPTGGAMPLLWAHAEYLKLLRSRRDRAVFDRIPEVAARYGSPRPARRPRIEIWKLRRQPGTIDAGSVLRVQAVEPFRLHWSRDDWATVGDLEAVPTGLGVWFVDLPTDAGDPGEFVFTFFWSGRGAWEGRDYRVAVRDGARGTAGGGKP